MPTSVQNRPKLSTRFVVSCVVNLLDEATLVPTPSADGAHMSISGGIRIVVSG
jgi:hypothetical protein